MSNDDIPSVDFSPPVRDGGGFSADEVDDIIADMSLDALAERNDAVAELVEEVDRIRGDDSPSEYSASSEKYERGETYSLDSGGDDGDDVDPSQKYQSGEVHDLPSE